MKMPPEPTRDMVQELVDGETTLTLATSGENGPWSAPVYFVIVDRRFFFFSSPQSRHIQHALKSGSAAASIFHQADAWRSIRGMQMRGAIERVHAVGLSVKVIAAYLQRFPFTRDFFPDHSTLDLDDFFSRFKARLYTFTPTNVHYTDNRFGFGSRQSIDW
jgi:uncharacterized protein YhbP (UPF0306 family)